MQDLTKMTNDEIWPMLEKGECPDPLTGAEAIVLNDIKDKVNITLVTEGVPAEVCEGMGIRHVAPDNLSAYIQMRLKEEPDLKIGILNQSAEVLPIVTSEKA